MIWIRCGLVNLLVFLLILPQTVMFFPAISASAIGALTRVNISPDCAFSHQGQAAAAASAATSAQVRAHVPVPSQDAIKEAILKRKKLSLLKRLDGGEDLVDALEDE